MSQKPYFIGGLCLLLGYSSAGLRRMVRPVPAELIRFHRSEQMARLRSVLFRRPKNRLAKGGAQ